MKLLYVAAPYRADTIYQIRQNIIEASKIAAHYWKKGYAVICPHMNSAFFDGLVPDEHFLNSTIEMLKHCDTIAFHPDWKNSEGCCIEHTIALRLNKFLEFPERKIL